MGKTARPGRVPLEALIVAFAHSRAKTLVGTDALRSVLSLQYRELPDDGAFDLEPVWELCAQQPGFDPVHVRPPLCRFKSWEAQLRITVLMPRAMAGLDRNALAELAAQVHVPARDLKRVFGGARILSGEPDPAAAGPVTETPRPPARAEPPTQVPQTTRTPLLRRLSRRRRRALEIAAVVLAVAGFAVAGIQLQRGCRGHSWAELSTRFAGDLPLAEAARQGPEVSGTLRDAGWFALSPAARTAQMKAALEALPRDVQSFFVRDRDGQVRAVARWFGQPRQIAVTLH
jgi:hypothetical protein